MKTLLLPFISLVVILVIAIGLSIWAGIGGFGPTRDLVVTVNNLYTHTSGNSDDVSTSYMVGTDKGAFEVDNGLLLKVWNADMIYSQLQVGKTYHIFTKGNRNIYLDAYPYIVAAYLQPDSTRTK